MNHTACVLCTCLLLWKMQLNVQYVGDFVTIDHCTVSVAILDVGQSQQNYSKCMGYCSTFNADYSAIIHQILTKKTSFKGY